ncbi:MAG: iron chelate uptake ABC transporter family permease subunit [Methanomicrobiaceae archaeon]|nr:iron chelate uptake ABC transporter family permease subunit [Methanomicrobiaceae archaeon]
MYHRRLTLAATAVLSILLVSAIVLSVMIGVSGIDVSTVISILAEPLTGEIPWWSSADAIIVTEIRLPRALIAAMVGVCLTASGVVLQGLFKNPMADPYFLGISNGAALGATIVIAGGGFLGLGFYSLPVLSFLFGLGTIFLVYSIARMGNQVPVTTLLLSGIAIAAFLSAVNSFILFTAEMNLHQILFWMMGGLSGRGWDYFWIILPFTVVVPLILVYLAPQMNAIMFGEESAMYAGVDVVMLKKLLIVLVSLITAAAVAVSGIIGFVGLIIPHIARLAVGPDHRILVPVSLLAGGVFLVLADIAARVVIAPAELPIGVITALCGVPFFLYLLRKNKGVL